MKRIITAILAALVTMAALTAQDSRQIQEILSKLEANKVSLSYRCVVDGQVPVELSGTLLIQGKCYLAKGNGLEIWCDGTDRWTVDPEAKEVYIEKAESVEELLMHTDEISDLSLTEVKYLPKGETGSFRFNVSALDSEWLITDLRD